MFYNVHLNPSINREPCPVTSTSCFSSSLSFSSWFLYSLSQELVENNSGCIIQTLTGGGLCVIKPSRIARSPGCSRGASEQPLIALGCCMTRGWQGRVGVSLEVWDVCFAAE